MKNIAMKSFLILFFSLVLSINIYAGENQSKEKSADKEIGKIIGDALYTDIKTYFNGDLVDGVNVNGYTYIKVKVFKGRNYSVNFDEKLHRVDIKKDYTVKDKVEDLPLKQELAVGTIVGHILSTDIKVYIEGMEIPAYNFDGEMIIKDSDLNPKDFKISFTENFLTKDKIVFIETNYLLSGEEVEKAKEKAKGKKLNKENVKPSKKQGLSDVVNEITIEDLQGKTVLKTEEFKIGETTYIRNYTGDMEYFITGEKDGNKEYYVNLLEIYPLVKFTESLKNEGNYAKLYRGYDNFITEYDLEDAQKITISDNSEIEQVNHFRKLER